jgi:hypothetical protein
MTDLKIAATRLVIIPAAGPADPVKNPMPKNGLHFSLKTPTPQSLRSVVQDQNGRPFADPVDWTSSNAAVATVGPTGVVAPHAAGACTITATSRSVPAVHSAVSCTVAP